MTENHDVQGFYNKLNTDCNFRCRINTENLSATVNDVIDQLSDEVLKRYYGSGFLIPENLEGKRVLDLGCGSGSLIFILSKLVGPTGHVVGVDFASGLIDTAKQESEYHWKKWGYDKPNMDFYSDNIERLTELGLEEESFDIVISNGVFCLCANKEHIFQQAYRMLKPNGMFLLGDVYANRQQSDDIIENKKLWCLCTAGSMLWSDLEPVLVKVGFTSPYLLSAGAVEIKNDELRRTTSDAEFACAEWRFFKLAPGDKSKAATVTYKGNIPDNPDTFKWDSDLTFKKEEATPVDGQLATILKATCFSDNFTFADCTDNVVTKREKNPFHFMKSLESQGKVHAPRYAVE